MAAVDSNWIMSSSAGDDKKAELATQQGEPTYASFVPPPNTLPQQSSPLLSSTPPTVTRALRNAYPFILGCDHLLGLITWTSSDQWSSFLVVVGWVTLVVYFEVLVTYFGHVLAVGSIAGYVWIRSRVVKDACEQPTLDAIVHTLNNVVTRFTVFVSPVTSLDLNKDDVSRLLFTTLFLSPLYIVVTVFVVRPRTFLLIGGLLVLTYHSMWARVTRAVFWRSRTIRLFTFYLTGIDFSGPRRRGGSSEAQYARTAAVGGGVQSKDGKPVQFTYVLYENQRRWLGIGWTPNLLAYERAPWTDEFLNEASEPESFQLPSSEGTGMIWRWVDKTWRLDLSNDGSLVIPSGRKSKTTANPGPNEAFIFYDNTWKKPSAEDSFTKYTRRRRWVRTAELVTTTGPTEPGPSNTKAGKAVDPESEGSVDASDLKEAIETKIESKEEESSVRQRKNLRFE